MVLIYPENGYQHDTCHEGENNPYLHFQGNIKNICAKFHENIEGFLMNRMT